MILFAISGIFALWFGFFAFDNLKMLEFYKDYVFWFLTINIILWIISVLRVYSSDSNSPKESINKAKTFLYNHRIAIIVAFLLMTVSTYFCKPEFRIFADEINLLSDSQNLYEAQECYTTHSVLEYSNGSKIILAAVLDKRPALFPYLISIIHFLTGYRPENAFILNFLSGFLSLILLYYLIQLFWGKYWGISGIIFLASYPLFIRYTNSGGFEIFNMLCSLIFFICLYNFIKNPDATRSETLLLFVPLLAQSRYESVLALFIALPLVFLVLPRKEYSKLSYNFIIFPLLLVAPAWLRLITNNAESWQVDSLEGGFGINWILINTQKALSFYFSGSNNYGINYILSYLAVIGFIMFIYKLFFNKPIYDEKQQIDNKEHFSHKIFWFSVFTFYLLHALIRFIYSWIDLTNPVINRLGIIFLPFLVLMAVYILFEISKKFYYCKYVFFIILIIPYFSGCWSYINIKDSLPYLDFNTCKSFLEKNFLEKSQYILIHYKPNLYTPFGYSSVGYNYYNKPEINNVVKEYFSQNQSKFYLAFQMLDIKTKTPSQNSVIPDELASDNIFETTINNAYILRVSKCVPKQTE